jgi:hypothetical protein
VETAEVELGEAEVKVHMGGFEAKRLEKRETVQQTCCTEERQQDSSDGFEIRSISQNSEEEATSATNDMRFVPRLF